MSFQQLEALIRSFHDIGAPSPALVARLKYFQRISFLDRQPGRGSRVGYEFEDVVRLLLAFEFVAAGLGPLRAANAVKANWRWMTTLLTSRWTVARSELNGSDPEVDASELIVLAPRLLGDDLSDGGASSTPGGGVAVMAMARSVVADWVRLPHEGYRASYVVIDPARIARLILERLPGLVGCSSSTVDCAFETLARRS